MSYVENNNFSANTNLFECIDSSYLKNISNEPVPQKGDSSYMKYFWDSVHIKYQLGDIVLRKVLKPTFPNAEAEA